MNHIVKRINDLEILEKPDAKYSIWIPDRGICLMDDFNTIEDAVSIARSIKEYTQKCKKYLALSAPAKPLLIDFWMTMEEHDLRARKHFSIYGTAPKIMKNERGIPFLSFEEGEMFQFENGERIPFTPMEKNALGDHFTLEEVMLDVLERLSRNETDVLIPLYCCAEANAYVSVFRRYIAANAERKIPFFIPFDNRLLHLVCATPRFLFYDDYLMMPVMFRTSDGTVISNNEFADIGFLDISNNIQKGTDKELAYNTFPIKSLSDFVSSNFGSLSPKISFYPNREVEAMDDCDELPF